MTKKKVEKRVTATSNVPFVVEDYLPEPEGCQMDDLFGAVDCGEPQTKKVWIGGTYYLLCSTCADELYQLVLELGLDG